MNWVKKLLHFASKSCYILSQKVATFRDKKLLHFASKVVTFRVDVTFYGVTPLNARMLVGLIAHYSFSPAISFP